MFNWGSKDWAIIGVGAFSIYSFYWLSGGWSQNMDVVQVDDSYEMQRPQDKYMGEYDLTGRPVQVIKVDKYGNRIIVKTSSDPVHQQPAANASGKNTKLATANKTAVNTKKTANNSNKKSTAQKKPKMDVKIVGGADRNPMQPFSNSTKSNPISPNHNVAVYQAPVPVNNPPQSENSDQNKEDQKLSPGQWFSLMQNQPTKENTVKFMKAKNELGAKVYYEIVQKLLLDSQIDRQKAAMYVLDQDVSLDTFIFLNKLPEEIKKQENIMNFLVASLKKYQDKSRFFYVARALDSQDPAIVVAAQNMLSEIILNNKKTISPSDPTTTPTTAANIPNLPTNSITAQNTVTIKDMNIFKQYIVKLANNPDPTIAKNAKEIFSALWQTTIVADSVPN